MIKLIINLSNSIIEHVTLSIINKLYDLISNNLLDNTSNLSGRIECDGSYLEYVNTIRQKFPNLYILCNKFYINFLDPVLKSLMINLYSLDNIGVSVLDVTGTSLSISFLNNTNIVSFNELNLLTNIKLINSNLFNGCSSLQSINLDNIETIKGSAFRGCSNLTSIGSTNNIKIIDERAFLQSAIQTVNAPNLTTLALDAFNSSGVTTVTSLGEITEIPAGCFSGCSYLTSVNIPDTCTNVKNIAFQNCTALTSIDLNNLTRTDNATFKGCTSLATVTSSDSLTTVGYQSFLNCSSLLSIDLTNATTLSYGSFDGCTSLLSVVLADGLTTIPGSCFYNCTSLTSINMPSSVKTIDNQAFNYTTANLLQSSDLTYIEEIVGHPINGNGAFAPGSFANEDLVLTNLKILNGSAFSKCSFKTISVPNLETIINDVATFSNNNVVTKIHVNPNVTVSPNYGSRGGGIFSYCSNLVKVTGLSSWTECYPFLFAEDSKLKYSDIDFTKITRLCSGLFKEGNTSNYFTFNNRIINFENLVHSYIDNNGSLNYSVSIASLCILSHVCFPKLKETTATKDKSVYGGPFDSFFVAGTKYTRIKNLYFRDIENFGVATFAAAIIDNLYLDTVTPPGLIPSTGTAATLSGINDDVFFYLKNKTAGNYNGITAPAITIYVPDSAVSTYLANPLYASVASNIVGISTAPHIAATDVIDITDPDDNDPTITYGKACSVDGLLPGYY